MKRILTTLVLAGFSGLLICSVAVAGQKASPNATMFAQNDRYRTEWCRPSGSAWCVCDRRCWANGQGQGNESCINRCLARWR